MLRSAFLARMVDVWGRLISVVGLEPPVPLLALSHPAGHPVNRTSFARPVKADSDGADESIR